MYSNLKYNNVKFKKLIFIIYSSYDVKIFAYINVLLSLIFSYNDYFIVAFSYEKYYILFILKIILKIIDYFHFTNKI